MFEAGRRATDLVICFHGLAYGTLGGSVDSSCHSSAGFVTTSYWHDTSVCLICSSLGPETLWCELGFNVVKTWINQNWYSMLSQVIFLARVIRLDFRHLELNFHPLFIEFRVKCKILIRSVFWCFSRFWYFTTLITLKCDDLWLQGIWPCAMMYS